MQTELIERRLATQTRRVLIVDDDHDFADSVMRLLQPRGYQAVTATTSAEALKALASHDAEVAMLDIRLGSDSGLSLLEDLKASKPELLCIMATAYADLDTAIEAIQKGAYDYLRKPISPPELFAALERSFDRLRLESERALLEKQLRQSQRLEAVGRLAGGVAHDFNNALTAILGNLDIAYQSLAECGDSVAPVRPRLDEIERIARHAATLTRQLLTFCRNQAVRLETVSMNAVITDIEQMLRRLIGEGIDLELRLADDLWSIRADAGQLGQIITNLIVNARDAMPGGGRLTIETTNVRLDENTAATHPDARPGRYVALVVTDTGCGIDPEVLEHVFEPFFTTKPFGEGTGLGLATVYGIVKQARGFVTVDSESYVGTTFTVYLPVTDQPSSTARPMETASKTATGPETILICEDEELIRQMLRQSLEADGHQVLAAASGPEALQLAERHDGPIHCLLTDITMPDMDGRKLARLLRERRPGIRVAFTSGYAYDAEEGATEINERTIFIAKPYTPRVLVERLRAFLDKPAPGDDGTPGSPPHGESPDDTQ